MKTHSKHGSIHVACALIERDGFILAAQRSEKMSLPLKWEFPGGKIEPGESPEDCLKRELREEMGISIDVGAPLSSTTHAYLAFRVTLYPFICSISSGELTLHEHKQIAWLKPEMLHALDWAAADLPVIAACQRIHAMKSQEIP